MSVMQRNNLIAFIRAMLILSLLNACRPSDEEKRAEKMKEYEPHRVIGVECNEYGCMCLVNDECSTSCSYIPCPTGTQVGASIQFINPIPL